jgi:hypothetical protein
LMWCTNQDAVTFGEKQLNFCTLVCVIGRR